MKFLRSIKKVFFEDWFYNKIKKVNFEGIKYVDIKTLEEYEKLVSALREMVIKDNIIDRSKLITLMIRIKEEVDNAELEKENAVIVRFSCVVMLIGIFSSIILAFSEYICSFITLPLAGIFLLFSFIYLLQKVPKILKLKRKTLLFYKTIESILESFSK